MTGDGAVVRLWEAEGWFLYSVPDGAKIYLSQAVPEHNALVAHALAQASEIERLTQTVEEKVALVIEACQLASQLRHRAEASEARSADLLKALDFAVKLPSEGIEFLRAWREGDTSEWPEFAAAKGETVRAAIVTHGARTATANTCPTLSAQRKPKP